VRFILFISFPATAGLIALAGPLMLLLSGHAFEPAVPLVQIMGLGVILTAVGHFIGYQVLYSQGKEKLLLYSVVLGAVANLILNWFLIPKWHAVGAAISTLITETCVTGIRIVLSRTYSHFTWPVWSMLKYGLTAISMAVVVLVFRSCLADAALSLLFPIAAGVAFYIIILWLLKDSMLSAIWNRLTIGTLSVRKALKVEP
jgi:O-antigen/teichoic acid export membrane protein